MEQVEVDARILRLVDDLGVIRLSAVSRLLDAWEGEQKASSRGVRIHRLVQRTGVERLFASNRTAPSVLCMPDRGFDRKFVAQLEHELRVADVAVEFVRQGFSWVPPAASGVGASKVCDGVAWKGAVEFQVEVELTAKKQKRWRDIVHRYMAMQEVRPVGVVYVAGSEGLLRSFNQVVVEASPPGWWYMGLSDSADVAARQRRDEVIVTKCVEAAAAGVVTATRGVQQRLEVSPDQGGDGGVFDPASGESEKARRARLMREEMEAKYETPEERS